MSKIKVSMSKKCDNFSVGVLIYNQVGELLLLERKKFPYGFAPPAGHIDDFASPENCARGEVSEEVGFKVTSLDLLYEGKFNYPCRREGGTHHYWYVYQAEVEGEIVPSSEETKQVFWCTKERLQNLIRRTELYKTQEISETEWENDPGFEPVWSDIFQKLKSA